MQNGHPVHTTTLDEHDFWSAYATVYEKVLRSFSPHVALMTELAEAVEGADVILDIGCGPGMLTERLASERPEERWVLGVDYNEHMLAYAQQRRRAGLGFRRMDACNLQLSDDRFDAITCSNLLYFVAEPERALTEMHRVLAPGGVLALTTPRDDCQIDILDEQLAKEVREEGSAELAEAYYHFVAFNRAISRDGLRNLFAPRDLRELVLGSGDFELLSLRTTYLGQNSLIVVRKGS